MRIYLDNCCFNRPFDDQRHLRIRLEAEAKLGIQEMIREKMVGLAWSYILDFENELNPFEPRRMLIRQWKEYAEADTDETSEIVERSQTFVQIGLRAKDALHVSCAIALGCDYFLTTDDQLIKKAAGIAEVRVTDPITFVKEHIQ